MVEADPKNYAARVDYMSKKITFNGIEILTSEDDSSAKGLLDYVENIIDHLEEDLDQVDGNFHLLINVDFSNGKPPRHSISTNSGNGQKAKEKVAKILGRFPNTRANKLSASVRVDLEVEDR
jgi:hypothetical protein